jgi:hypothetical protein
LRAFSASLTAFLDRVVLRLRGIDFRRRLREREIGRLQVAVHRFQRLLGAIDLVLGDLLVHELVEAVARHRVLPLQALERLLLLVADFLLVEDLAAERFQIALVLVGEALRLRDLRFELRLLVEDTRLLERGLGFLGLAQVERAELALVDFPLRVPVVDHHPDDGDQEHDARNREPAIEGQRRIVRVAAVSHGS